MRVRRVDETSEECFLCFFSRCVSQNGAKRRYRFGRRVAEKVKKVAKNIIFWRTKTVKTSTFWSFWNFTERKNVFIFGWFLETFSKYFKHFSHFFYLKAQQLFSMIKFGFFLTLEAVVRAEIQNHENGNCLIPRVGWRQMRGFHHFFHFFGKKGSEMIKISETALTTAF